MLVTFLSVLFYYYPSLLTTILSLFSCYRIDHLSPGQLYPEFIQVRVTEQLISDLGLTWA